MIETKVKMHWGALIFLKNRKDQTSYTQFDLQPNQTYTIGTGTDSNIRLKVEDTVPEFSILQTNSEGVVNISHIYVINKIFSLILSLQTEFKSNTISECEINHIPFQGVRYLIPGDVLTLFDRQFRYENPSFGQEVSFDPLDLNDNLRFNLIFHRLSKCCCERIENYFVRVN